MAQFRRLPLKLRGSIAVVIILSGAAFFMPAYAVTSRLEPVSNVSCNWAVTCSYANIDEGLPANPADYIGTGTNGADQDTATFEMADPPNVATATQLVLNVDARSATIASSADFLNFSLKVGGVQLGIAQATMTSSFGWYSFTYTGSWTQADVNNMQVVLTRVVNGGGSPSARDDDVQVDSVYVDVTYTQNANVSQQDYRFYNNNATAVTNPTFALAMGGTGDDYGRYVVQNADGGYTVASAEGSYGAGGSDVYLAKYDSTGKQQWCRIWGGASPDIAAGLIKTASGGYAVSGYTQSYGAGGLDAFLAVYDSSGNLQWARTWGGTGDEYNSGVVQTSDGGYAISGDTTSYGTGGDLFVVRYDANGALQWAKTWGTASTEYNYGLSVTSGDGFLVTGESAANAVLLKIDSTGGVVFARTLGGTGNDDSYIARETSDGGYVMSGNVDGYGAGGAYDAYLAKYDSAGTLQWVHTWGGAQYDVGEYFTLTADGGYIMTGDTNSFGAGGYDMFLVKFDSTGTVQWARTFGGTGDERGYGVIQTSDGGYAVGGDVASYGGGGIDGLLARYDSNGNITGCSAPTCQTPAALTATPTVPTATPSLTTNSPAITSPAPSLTLSSITPATVYIYQPPAPTVGTPLAAANTAAIAPATGTPFRLRLNLGVSNGQLDSGSFKLQFAVQDSDGVCNNNESGYADITSTSAVKFYDNANVGDGAPYSSSASDPTRTGVTVVGQTYSEANPFSIKNAIPASQDGLWDFALTTDVTAAAGVTYCIKAVNSSGGDLNSYTQIAAVSTLPPRLGQADYRFFEDGTATVPTAQAWGGAGNENGQSVAATTDGGYIVTGTTGSFAGSGGAYLAKYDSTGNLSWSRAWDGVVNNSPYRVIQTADGGYATAGITTNVGAGANDILLVKFDSNGNVSWSRTWGSTGGDEAYTLVQTTDGGYVIGAATSSFAPGGSYDVATVKFDASGTLQWARTWGNTGFDLPYGAVASSDGGAVITGSTASTNDAFLLKYDSTGNLSWSRTWVSSLPDTGYGVVQTGDGGYAVTGSTNGYGAGNSEIFLAKFNSSGTLQWSRTLGTSGVEYGRGISTTADGGLVVTGYSDTLGTGGGVNDVVIAKYDSSGTLQWTRTWGGTGSDTAYGIVQATDGSLGVVGTTASYGAGGNDMVFLRYGSDGSMLNCSAPMCQSVTPTTSSPAATSSTPTASTSSPSGTVTSPSIATVSITPTVTSIVAGDVITANTPLAAQDTATNVDVATPFRLRSRIAVDDGNLQQSGQSFKLQYKAKTAQICDPNATGYADITAAAGAGGSSGQYAGSATESPDGGNSWTTLSAATGASDGSTASVYVGNQQTDYFANTLQLTNYGMNIPAGTTVTGITATISGNKDSNSTMTGFSVVNRATGKSLDLRTTTANFTTGNPVTYGSSTSAGSFTASDVNDSNFGVSLNFESVGSSTGNVYIDAVQITVYYSSGGSATDIAYYDNPALSDGTAIAATDVDPTDGARAAVSQSYRETAPFTNNAAAVPAGSDGLWDFALTSSAAADGKTYCLRVVRSDGSLLDSYLQLPEITVGTPPPAGPTLEQQLRGGQSVLDGLKTPFL